MLRIFAFLISIWVDCIIGADGSRLLETPADLTNFIFSHFDIRDRTKHVADLNKKCNKWYTEKHKEEIEDVEKLRHWFAKNEYKDHLDEISAVAPKLKTSEYFYMFLPEMLSSIHEHWISDVIKDEEVTSTLYDMKLFPLSIVEFNSATSSLNDSLRLYYWHHVP